MKTLNNRWFSLALAVPAFLLLTGAKGEGCGGSVVVEPEPPVETCPAGSHLSTVCDDVPEPISSSSSGSSSDSSGADPAEPGCRTECVPDDVCPDGTVAIQICDPVALPCEWDSASGEPGCMDPEPAPSECYFTCEPACADGSHAERVCYDDPIVSGEPDSGSGDEPMPPPEPGDCFLECVPDLCPPGYTEVGVCEITAGDPEATCWTDCVPEQQCPPGCYAEGTCSGSDGSGAPEEDCVTVCRCEEPSEPPPDAPQAS